MTFQRGASILTPTSTILNLLKLVRNIFVVNSMYSTFQTVEKLHFQQYFHKQKMNLPNSRQIMQTTMKRNFIFPNLFFFKISDLFQSLNERITCSLVRLQKLFNAYAEVNLSSNCHHSDPFHDLSDNFTRCSHLNTC